MADTEHTVTVEMDCFGTDPILTVSIECHGDPADDRRSCRMADVACVEAATSGMYGEQETPCPVHGGTIDRCPAIAVDGEFCAARHYLDAGGPEAVRFTGSLYPIETPFRARVWWDGDDFPSLEPLTT